MIDSTEAGFSAPLEAGHETDVVVVGGGPAGTAAALSAGENGADVLLIEKENYLGGNATGGYVYVINGFRGRREDNPLVVGGVALEIFEELLEAGGTHATEEGLPVEEDHGQFHDPNVLVTVLDDMMKEAGVDVRFNTHAFDVYVEDGAVEGVAVANKSGGQVVLADRVVDCTGDADVAAAGAPFEVGREEDGRSRGIALMMVVGGIDVHRLIDYLSDDPDVSQEELADLDERRSRLVGGGGEPGVVTTVDGERVEAEMTREPRDWEVVREDLEAGNPLNFSVRGGPTGMGVAYEVDGTYPPEVKYNRAWLEYVEEGNVPPQPGTDDLVYPPPPSLGVLGFGMYYHGKRRYDTMLTGMYESWFDQVDAEAIRNGIVFGRRLNGIYLDFLRERIPGFEDAYVVSHAPKIGKRDSRRIVGEYVLTAEDISAGRRFPDGISKGNRSAGSHSVTGVWGTFVSGEYQPFEVPYRCLLPTGVDDLLVAGRSISATFLASSGIRNMAPCMATGEAAGAAAALSSRLDVAPRDLDHRILQNRLASQGAILSLPDEEPKAAELEEPIALEELTG